jgi:hypothetical protein
MKMRHDMTAVIFTALILTWPVGAATCHRYSKWMYPWPQPACSIRHAAPTDAAPTPQGRPSAADEPSADAFTARWSAAAADAVQRNLTPACGSDHCSLSWQNAAGLTMMLFSYTDGTRLLCVDDGEPTIDCVASDGAKQIVEVKSDE